MCVRRFELSESFESLPRLSDADVMEFELVKELSFSKCRVLRVRKSATLRINSSNKFADKSCVDSWQSSAEFAMPQGLLALEARINGSDWRRPTALLFTVCLRSEQSFWLTWLTKSTRLIPGRSERGFVKEGLMNERVCWVRTLLGWLRRIVDEIETQFEQICVHVYICIYSVIFLFDVRSFVLLSKCLHALRKKKSNEKRNLRKSRAFVCKFQISVYFNLQLLWLLLRSLHSSIRGRLLKNS